MPALSPDTDAITPLALSVRNVVVPLDGSTLAEVALPVGVWLRERLAAELHLVRIATLRALSDAQHDLDAHASQLGVASLQASVVVSDDVQGEIEAVARRLADHVVCMATHGRSRSAAVLGSIATDVLHGASGPVILVGRGATPGAVDAPVIVCVDGGEGDARVLATAAGWSIALGVPLDIVTVFEPAPLTSQDTAPHRHHGPDDPGAYLDALRRRLPASLDVTVHALEDPVSVAGGLTPRLVAVRPQLVVTATHARSGVARALTGSIAASIIHQSPAPVLAVPLDATT